MIRDFVLSTDLDEVLSLIHKAFLTVAKDFNLSPENAPSNPAFMSLESFEMAINKGLELFVYEEKGALCACIGIEAGKAPGEYYIERLAVLPEARHQRLGSSMLDYALEKILSRGGNRASIGIINENTVLKNWYLKQGFHETGIRTFSHLPFTVCFLERILV